MVSYAGVKPFKGSLDCEMVDQASDRMNQEQSEVDTVFVVSQCRADERCVHGFRELDDQQRSRFLYPGALQ